MYATFINTSLYSAMAPNYHGEDEWATRKKAHRIRISIIWWIGRTKCKLIPCIYHEISRVLAHMQSWWNWRCATYMKEELRLHLAYSYDTGLDGCEPYRVTHFARKLRK